MADSTRYGWTWYLPADDPDERGSGWISIETLDEDGSLSGDEIAVVMCRNYDAVLAEHPEWISDKEAAAQLIVDVLNSAREEEARRT